MILSKCTVCDSKKSNFMKQQEANGLLSSSGITTRLSKISLLGLVLFQRYQQANRRYRVNKTIKKFLLGGDNNLDLHIVLVDHFQKTKRQYKNLKKQEICDIFIKTN